MPDIDSRLTGAAGEHYVICQLIRRGYVAAQAPEGVAKMDVVASDREGNHLFAIQVKTRNARGADGGWHMKAKHETPVVGVSFCLVDFGADPSSPIKCYVVPSTTIAHVLSAAHQIWGRGEGKKGPRDISTEMRRLLPNYQTANFRREGITDADKEWISQHGPDWLIPYAEAWHLLSTKT